MILKSNEWFTTTPSSEWTWQQVIKNKLVMKLDIYILVVRKLPSGYTLERKRLNIDIALKVSVDYEYMWSTKTNVPGWKTGKTRILAFN